MLVIPWQAIAASERNLTHLLSSNGGNKMELVIKHMAEHDGHVLHHHDDEDEDDHVDHGDHRSHDDSSQKSSRHLANYDQGCGMNILLPGFSKPCLPVFARATPVLRLAEFTDRSVPPLLRPPRSHA